MFDIGLWEILLIGVLALVVIGPERLPGAARQAGFFVGKARRYIEGVKSEVASELDVDEFKRALHNQEVQINELQRQLKSGIDEVKSELPSADFLTEPSSHELEDDVEAGSENAETDSSAQVENQAKSQADNQPDSQPDNPKKKINNH